MRHQPETDASVWGWHDTIRKQKQEQKQKNKDTPEQQDTSASSSSSAPPPASSCPRRRFLATACVPTARVVAGSNRSNLGTAPCALCMSQCRTNTCLVGGGGRRGAVVVLGVRRARAEGEKACVKKACRWDTWHRANHACALILVGMQACKYVARSQPPPKTPHTCSLSFSLCLTYPLSSRPSPPLSLSLSLSLNQYCVAPQWL